MKKIMIKKLIISVLLICFAFLLFLNNSSQSLAIETNNYINVKEGNVYQIPAKQQKYYAMNFNPDDYNIVKIVQTIGSILSVITLMIIAIKYMMGSVEEKAQYKKVMMPYVIGCFLIFGITNILAIIINVISNTL